MTNDESPLLERLKKDALNAEDFDDEVENVEAVLNEMKQEFPLLKEFYKYANKKEFAVDWSKFVDLYEWFLKWFGGKK